MKKQLILTLWASGLLIFVFLFNTDTASAKSNQPKPFESSLPSGEGFWEENLPPYAQKAWQSTVQVRCIQIQMFETEKIKKKVKVGAGIIIDLDPERKVALIVTNNHCIKHQKNLVYQYEVRIPLKPDKDSKREKYFLTRDVSIVMAQPNKDLFYLSVQYPHNPHPTVASLKAVDNDGISSRDLISIGFPYLYLRQKENWNVSRPKNYKKIIKRYSRGKLLAKGLSGDHVHILAHNADMLRGNCGGPLVDEEGNVVGINSLVVHPDDKSVDDPSLYDYCPGAPNCFYVAISTSGEVRCQVNYFLIGYRLRRKKEKPARFGNSSGLFDLFAKGVKHVPTWHCFRF